MLDKHQKGSTRAKEELIQTIYDELKSIAAGMLNKELSNDQSCAVIDLVHDAYLRLEANGLFGSARNRRHLFGAVHRAMRQVLVDRARYRKARKRFEAWVRIPLDDQLDKFERANHCTMQDLDEALEKLGARHPRAAEIIDLRLFGGLTQQQIADMLSLSLSSVEADLRLARAMLREELAT